MKQIEHTEKTPYTTFFYSFDEDLDESFKIHITCWKMSLEVPHKIKLSC